MKTDIIAFQANLKT